MNEGYVTLLPAWSRTNLPKKTPNFCYILQVEEVTHHLVGASSPPDFYTIKEEVEFSITIKEKKNGAWVPFTGTDVQVSEL
jgi:hypothetical protein